MRGVGGVLRRLCVLLVFAAALVAPSVSSAALEIVPGSIELETLDPEGNPDTRAGAHPDRLVIRYAINSGGSAMRDIEFDFGPGLTGTPSAAPACPRALFENENERCPTDTRVGTFSFVFGEEEPPSEVPVYNVSPASDQIAVFGIPFIWESELAVSLRPSDFGLTMAIEDMPQMPVSEGKVELWGVPGAHSGGASGERAALLTTPTDCGPLRLTIGVRSWEAGSPRVTESGESAPFTECENLIFEPEAFGMELNNPKPDSPTGARIDLEMAIRTDPDGQVSANLRAVDMKFPPGLTVSPGGVEGVELCGDAQFGFGTASEVTCPPRSRIGTVEIETPQLSTILTGPIFLGQEAPGERFRLFVDARGPGIEVKTVGKLVPDPLTGQLSAVLTNLPQVALDRISLTLGNGSGPILATPLTCGSVLAQARFSPYGPHPAVDSPAVVDVDGGGAGCPSSLGFSPRVTAGGERVRAGADTGFSFTAVRHDGEQLIRKFASTLPPGLNANLTKVRRCASAAAAAGRCGRESRVGSALAEVGSGPNTALVRGDVYVTAPYRNAPFGVLVVFDATVGPYHLGDLAVRGMLRVDPVTGQLKMETDPLPPIFEGLALRFRTIAIDLDRPGFLLNPTSCEAKQITSTVASVDGRATSSSSPFHVSGCERLGFEPRPQLALENRRARTGGSVPELSIGVRTRPGDANLSQFKVKLPPVIAFHGRGIDAVCARGDAVEGVCPPASRVGTAVARTPLLDEPLRGPVYLVQPRGGGFPDFWSSLESDGVKIHLAAESFRRKGRLVTELKEVPDLPLRRYAMKLTGGDKGLFHVEGNLCARRRPAASVALEAQNGAARSKRVQLEAECRGGGDRKARVPAKSAGRRPHR
jgi:hypothetical protein